MLFDFSAIKRSVQGLDERLKTIGADIEKLRREREAIALAPTAKADVKALLAGWVRESAASHVSELQASVEAFARNPVAMRNPSRVKQLATFNGADQPYGDAAGPHELGKTICAVFGAQIVDTLTKAVDAMEWPANAVGASERARKVDEFDARITTLVAEQIEIREKAHAVGINLE